MATITDTTATPEPGDPDVARRLALLADILPSRMPPAPEGVFARRDMQQYVLRKLLSGPRTPITALLLAAFQIPARPEHLRHGEGFDNGCEACAWEEFGTPEEFMLETARDLAHNLKKNGRK